MSRRAAEATATGAGALPKSQMARPGVGPLPPWPAMLLMITIVLPIYFSIGGLLLTPLRIICLTAAVVVPVQLFLMRRLGPVTVVDWLICFYAFWVMLSYIENHGTSKIVFGGLQVVNILGAYMVGRVAIREVAHLQAVARLMPIFIIFLLPFAIYENINARYVIPAFIESIPGLTTVGEIDYGRRLNLDRAQVVFRHPIHWGLYCSLPIALFSVGLANHVSLATRIFVSVLVVGTCFTSLSSGPFLATIFQLALIAYALVLHSRPDQWKLMLWGSAGAYVVLELLSDRFVFYALGSRLAFNKHTAHYRTLIWEYGTLQVERTPLFGVGAGEWVRLHWMPYSIDNYWLQIAVTSGVPASFAMIAVFLYSMIRMGRGHYVKGTDAYYMRVAVTILLIGLALSLGTVTIWNELLSMVMFLIGASAFMLQAQPAEDTGSAPVSPVSRRARPGGGGRSAPSPARASAGGPVYTRYPAGGPSAGSDASGGVPSARRPHQGRG